MYGINTGALIIGGIFAAISWIISNQLKSKFKKYAAIPTSSGLSGKDVAERMLSENGITDVQVVSVQGQLTDHYNPSNKTVNLSEVVYNERNVSAAAVAAHECGHAIQHATSYKWLEMRSRVVPMVKISSNLFNWVIIIGLGLAASGGSPTVLLIGILMFAVTTFFAFVTLPVEYDASNRALAWLENTGITAAGEEHDGAKDALKWAARTYVVAALGSLATLFYYLRIYNNSRR